MPPPNPSSQPTRLNNGVTAMPGSAWPSSAERPVEAKIDHAVKQIQAMVAARQASGLSQRFV